MNSPDMLTQPEHYLLTPLAWQPLRHLVCLLVLVSLGEELRTELNVPGLSDGEVVRLALGVRDWRVAP
jgi:hypothetical protein